MSTAVTSTYAFATVDDAIAAVTARLAPLDAEHVPLHTAVGRALSDPVVADRPSPACDVSAMDGYAVYLADLPRRRIPVTAEVAIGQAPPALAPGGAARIVTGGAVPAGAEAVIPRERLIEHGDAITIPADLAVPLGQSIRRRGENGQAGDVVVSQGMCITPATIAAAAAFGYTALRVHRRVRVAAIVTGNEVHALGAAVEPWQLRDSNGPALQAMLAHLPWLDWMPLRHAADDRAVLTRTITEALASSDALLLTGGVSMGDFDFVPQVLRDCGVDIIFHRLPIRPGKPILAGVGPSGQAVVALPGNPVSVMVGARRLATPILRHLAGFAAAPPPQRVTVANDDGKTLDLQWFRLARLTSPGVAELADTRGSGDIVSAARADGFVEVPAGAGSGGVHPFYPWSIGA